MSIWMTSTNTFTERGTQVKANNVILRGLRLYFEDDTGNEQMGKVIEVDDSERVTVLSEDDGNIYRFEVYIEQVCFAERLDDNERRQYKAKL